MHIGTRLGAAGLAAALLLPTGALAAGPDQALSLIHILTFPLLCGSAAGGPGDSLLPNPSPPRRCLRRTARGFHVSPI